MIDSLRALYRPAAHAPRLPESQIAAAYRRYRWQMMLAIFVGYASFYFVRSNFANAKPYLESQLGFSKSDIGLVPCFARG